VQVYSRSIIVHFIPRDLKIRNRQALGVHNRAAALRPRASDKENPVESIVMNFAIGDAPGRDREFSVTVERMPDTPQGGSLARTHEGKPGLPRGRSRLPARAVRASQVERLRRAAIAAIAEAGYADVTVADIVRRAKVSRVAFYTHFRTKEDCFLAATREGGQLLADRPGSRSQVHGGRVGRKHPRQDGFFEEAAGRVVLAEQGLQPLPPRRLQLDVQFKF